MKYSKRILFFPKENEKEIGEEPARFILFNKLTWIHVFTG